MRFPKLGKINLNNSQKKIFFFFFFAYLTISQRVWKRFQVLGGVVEVEVENRMI